MTWIKTVPMAEASDELKAAYRDQAPLYPKEYATPVPALTEAGVKSSIVASHTLIPQALFHAFANFGSLLSPDLPLSRQQHEMIATTVSVLSTTASIEPNPTQSFCVAPGLRKPLSPPSKPIIARPTCRLPTALCSTGSPSSRLRPSSVPNPTSRTCALTASTIRPFCKST